MTSWAKRPKSYSRCCPNRLKAWFLNRVWNQVLRSRTLWRFFCKKVSLTASVRVVAIAKVSITYQCPKSRNSASGISHRYSISIPGPNGPALALSRISSNAYRLKTLRKTVRALGGKTRKSRSICASATMYWRGNSLRRPCSKLLYTSRHRRVS